MVSIFKCAMCCVSYLFGKRFVDEADAGMIADCVASRVNNARQVVIHSAMVAQNVRVQTRDSIV